MYQHMEGIDDEKMAADKAAVDAVLTTVQGLWNAQVESISVQVNALPDAQKGRFLVPIARMPIGQDQEPEGLSEWGKSYFKTKVAEIRKATLAPLYP